MIENTYVKLYFGKQANTTNKIPARTLQGNSLPSRED